MSKNLFAVLLFSATSVTTINYKVSAINSDDQLKTYNTQACKAFSEVARPDPGFTLRRHTQEDTGRFNKLRAMCERSVAQK